MPCNIEVTLKHHHKNTCVLKLALFLIFCKGVIDHLQDFLYNINVQALYWDIKLHYFKIP